MHNNNYIMRHSILFILLLALTACNVNSSSQDDRKYVRSGNKLFRQGKFEEAATEYKKAYSANKTNPQAIYNLGCAELNLQQDSTAVSLFNEAAKYEHNKIRKAMAYHNIGVVFHTSQQYDAAIEAYKEALRNNPADNETRYNLELAKRQKKNNQNQQQNNQDNQNQDKQDQDKQNQDKQNQDKQNQDKQNQDKQNQDKQNQDNQQDQNKEDKQNENKNESQQQISDDNAERLLDAAVQEEKRTQEKINKAMQQPRKRILQKNW